MIAISIRFLTGRFHATPWGHQVNEGAVEWPPAPWRILRALCAAWVRHEDVRDTHGIFLSLLAALSDPPLFALPEARVAHTRHYMPWRKQAGKMDTTLVLDTFAAPGRDPEVHAIWPDATLASEEQTLLDRLLRRVPYLGRAESWADLRRIGDPGEPNARPLAPQEAPQDEESETLLLACDGAPSLDALELDTLDMRHAGRDVPEGTRWQRYARPATILEPVSPPRRRPPEGVSGPALARFALHAPALTSVRYTLFLGEDVRRALMSRVQASSAVFSGRRDGAPRHDNNRHAFFLPEDADGDGRIDHVTVHALEGFGPAERRALESFRLLRRYGKGFDQLLLLEYLGPTDRFTARASITGPSKTWISATPFCLLRHPKRNGKDGPIHQLRLELSRRGLPAPSSIELLGRPPIGPPSLEWRHFRRRRASQPPRVDLPGMGFRIEFPEAVLGPIALGYACHFGLGRFAPARESTTTPERSTPFAGDHDG